MFHSLTQNQTINSASTLLQTMFKALDVAGRRQENQTKTRTLPVIRLCANRVRQPAQKQQNISNNKNAVKKIIPTTETELKRAVGNGVKTVRWRDRIKLPEGVDLSAEV